MSLIRAFNNKKDTVARSTTASNKNNIEFVNNMLENSLAATTGKLHKTPILTSKILMEAPSYFFDKFSSVTAKCVLEIQTAISSGDNAAKIAAVQADPTNFEARKTAYNIIDNELIKYNNRDPVLSSFSAIEREVIFSLIANEILGFGVLDPLWNDKSITEIIVNGPNDVQVEIKGQLYRVESCKFRSKRHLQDLIDRLYSTINKSVTRTNPLAKGRLYDNSRMMAIHEVVAPNGPNFNIRRHQEDYWTADDIINHETADEKIMTFLGNYIYHGVSFLVTGGTGTGKSTLLNSLTGFFKDDYRIVTLEDNLELKPHPGKLFAAPMECVPARPGAINENGITMRDLVKAALQMRPDGILIGEVTDAAAYDLCQALNTGHWGASTVHANSVQETMERLMALVCQSGLIKEQAAYMAIASAFDIVIQVDRMEDGSRKITNIGELAQRPVTTNGILTLPVNPLWEYRANKIDPTNGKVTGEWVQIGDISPERKLKHRINLVEPLSWEQLKAISSI